METKAFVHAAMLAALFGLTSTALAQYGPAAGPYGPGAPYGVAPYGMSQAAMAAAYQPMGEAPTPLGCADAAYGCNNCGNSDCCGDCCPGWCHRVQVFGEFLFLKPRNAEVAYAVPVDIVPIAIPPGTQQVQTGPVEVVDPDFQTGFRAGAGFTLNECSSIVASYTWFDSQTSDSVTLAGGGGPLLSSLVSHPFPINAIATYLDATASLDIGFQLIDVDYKGLFAYNCDYRANYVIGARYANLDQHFAAQFTTNGFENVFSAVEFDGGGLKLGLEGERYGVNSQWFAYGKAMASFIGGEFRTRYTYGTNTDPVVTDTSWRSGRIVSIYDMEVGLGWRNHCDNFRLSVGYTYSFWTNVVMTREWINAVQQNNFVDQSDNFDGLLTFDGATAKVEVLW